LAHWVLGSGGVLEFLIGKFELIEKFSEIYSGRYKDSISFIDEIINQRNNGNKAEFYISYLATNELFSALRDELRSIILFNNGIPISRWRDSRNNPDINSEHYKVVYEKTLKSFDILFENSSILFIPEQSPDDDPNYWEIYSSIIFLIKESKTQDAILLTTAILNGADYFVTKDEPLIKSAKKMVNKEYKLNIIRPREALHIMRGTGEK
jgi:predicted nucleic acid-binding protein